MNTVADVIVVGAGAGGICSALAAARTGANTLLIERASKIGGTGVHSPVSLICKFHGVDHRPINMGIHRELFPEAYEFSTQDKRGKAPRLTYDEKKLAERYQSLLAAEPNLTVLTEAEVSSVEVKDRAILSISLEDGRRLRAPVFIDSTADGNLAAMAGCAFHKGRSQDGAMQSATLVFAMSSIDKTMLAVPEFSTRKGLASLWLELTDIFLKAKKKGLTDNPRKSVLCFPYPDGERLLFNSNEVLGVDPTVPGSVEKALKKGQQYVDELVQIILKHPAFVNAKVDFIAKKMGVREGRRIVGDYTITENDCLGEARFDDMIAACAYEIDIHDPDGGVARIADIPGSGYYHIPYRSLIASDMDNVLMGSRCISGTHEAHSSYRVISGVSAIGQAAGTAAALSSQLTGGKVRELRTDWIRYVLREQLQFVEGSLHPPHNWIPDCVS